MLQNGPRQLGQGLCSLLSLWCRFWTLSSPNPPKRTPCSPSGVRFDAQQPKSSKSAWLCSLLSLWWSVLAAQQPKFSKTDLASLVCLAVLEQSKAHGTRNYTIVEVPVECHAEMLRLHHNRQSAVVGEQAVEVLSSSSRTDLRSTQSQRDMVSPEIPQLIARKTIQRSAL